MGKFCPKLFEERYTGVHYICVFNFQNVRFAMLWAANKGDKDRLKTHAWISHFRLTSQKSCLKEIERKDQIFFTKISYVTQTFDGVNTMSEKLATYCQCEGWCNILKIRRSVELCGTVVRGVTSDMRSAFQTQLLANFMNKYYVCTLQWKLEVSEIEVVSRRFKKRCLTRVDNTYLTPTYCGFEFPQLLNGHHFCFFRVT